MDMHDEKESQVSGEQTSWRGIDADASLGVPQPMPWITLNETESCLPYAPAPEYHAKKEKGVLLMNNHC
jgi:hypothetical protein